MSRSFAFYKLNSLKPAGRFADWEDFKDWLDLNDEPGDSARIEEVEINFGYDLFDVVMVGDRALGTINRPADGALLRELGEDDFVSYGVAAE